MLSVWRKSARFRPAVAGNVRRGDAWRFSWSGTPTPEIERDKRWKKVKP